MKYIWLDVDPVSPLARILTQKDEFNGSQGHDDATAIMLALNLPNIHLLGISTVRRKAVTDLFYGLS